MKLVFIRHAETDWNAAGRWQGHADLPLNTAGREQAARLAQRLAQWPLDVVLSSDLRRAVETARPVAEAGGRPLLLRPEWRERDVGQASGLTTPEIIARWPDLDGQSSIQPPGSEPLPDFRQRIVAALENLLANGQGWENIAVVTHGGVIHSVLGHVWGFPADQPLPLTGRVNTSITTLQLKKGVLRPAVINDHAHLEPLVELPEEAF